MTARNHRITRAPAPALKKPEGWAAAGLKMSSPIRVLRLTDVMRITGLRKTALYELQAAGAFPLRVQLTPRSVGWVESEVQLWLATKLAERARPTPYHRP